MGILGDLNESNWKCNKDFTKKNKIRNGLFCSQNVGFMNQGCKNSRVASCPGCSKHKVSFQAPCSGQPEWQLCY